MPINRWQTLIRRDSVAIYANLSTAIAALEHLSSAFHDDAAGTRAVDRAALVKPVILQCIIGEKLDSLATNNAANNGKCLESLQRSFGSMDPRSCCTRCHVINLLIRALLFGGVLAYGKFWMKMMNTSRTFSRTPNGISRTLSYTPPIPSNAS